MPTIVDRQIKIRKVLQQFYDLENDDPCDVIVDLLADAMHFATSISGYRLTDGETIIENVVRRARDHWETEIADADEDDFEETDEEDDEDQYIPDECSDCCGPLIYDRTCANGIVMRCTRCGEEETH